MPSFLQCSGWTDSCEVQLPGPQNPRSDCICFRECSIRQYVREGYLSAEGEGLRVPKLPVSITKGSLTRMSWGPAFQSHCGICPTQWMVLLRGLTHSHLRREDRRVSGICCLLERCGLWPVHRCKYLMMNQMQGQGCFLRDVSPLILLSLQTFQVEGGPSTCKSSRRTRIRT